MAPITVNKAIVKEEQKSQPEFQSKLETPKPEMREQLIQEQHGSNSKTSRPSTRQEINEDTIELPQMAATNSDAILPVFAQSDNLTPNGENYRASLTSHHTHHLPNETTSK